MLGVSRKPLRRAAAALTLALLAAAALGARGSAAAPVRTAAVADSVTVSPLPGTPDASASTQISFLGGPGTRVSDVRAWGSRSGRHSGTLEAYSTGTGESFLPKRPFVAGERVSITARVSEGSAGHTVRTQFTIAHQAPIPQAPFPVSPGDPADVLHYLSAPTLTASTVRVITPARPGAAPGDFFLSPNGGAGTPGPMIVDQSGNLVWFDPEPAGMEATNLHPQTYEGKEVLTWWQGHIIKLGFGEGADEIYSTSYQPLAQVLAGNGYKADLHQFLLTPQGTAWIDAYNPVDMNLSSVGGSRRGVLTDSIVQEIDVKTGLVMWEWHALGHFPISDSYDVIKHGSHAWDYFHLNAVDPGADGQLLMSSRNTWTVFDVKMATGAVLWRIGGKHPTFKPGAGTVFRFQHDATWQPGGLVSVFDNGYAVDGDVQSRGLLLDPDLKTRRVSLVKQFTNPDERILTNSQGDLLNLGDGDWLMGYGGEPNFTEYSSSGKVLFDATLGPDVASYRTYLYPWRAQPATPPSIAAQGAPGGAPTVEASWNGATTVSSWVVLAGSSPGSLTPVATVPKSGFETTIPLATAAAYVAVEALGSSGQLLATSATIAPSA